uniref:Golgi SNAP receptor complex member 1 n=1 Tax=Strongyloides stercoralis TaxID=6248 RepID=A0AAF5CSF6_STRER
MANSWDGLRKRARIYENEIDSKLMTFNKITASGSSFGSQTMSLTNKKDNFTLICNEIEQLIQNLTTVNDEMDVLVSKDVSLTNNAAITHTLRRHHDILRDYYTEFNRSKNNIESQLMREDLVGGSCTIQIEESNLNNRVNGRNTELYMRENDRINSCDRLMDEQLSLAMSVKENLYGQKSILINAKRSLKQMTQKYPMINNVLQKIKNKKRKDKLILAGVIIVDCYQLSIDGAHVLQQAQPNELF